MGGMRLLEDSQRYATIYSCPVRLEKSARHVISSAVAELMNKSILWGTCPIQLKNAKVIPVRKTIMIYL